MKDAADPPPRVRGLDNRNCALPAVSLRSTAGFILSRLRRWVVSRAIAIQRRRRVRLKGTLAACFGRSVSPGFVVQRRRRVGLKAGVERSGTAVTVTKDIPNPWQRVTEAPLQVTLIKRQIMRSQDHLEFLEKRNRSMMLFLPLDITSHLRNLRLADAERAIIFLPREAGGVGERSRNPTRRIGFDFADQLGDRLVLPQSRQDVDVISGSIHDQRDSAFAANRAAEIFMNPGANRRRHPRLPVLRGKHNVIQKVAKGGTHSGGPFRRPFAGAGLLSHDIPGVPLRSTPSCSSAALHCRLFSGAPVALFSIRPGAERRRRAGLKPRVKRSGTRGTSRNDLHLVSKPLTRGGGKSDRTSSAVDPST
jgi:hypothetical protein